MSACWSPLKKHSDRERWICVYPAYINNRKTLAEGRRVPKEKAVENPTYQEIRDVLASAGLRVGVENKIYSRERSKELLQRGRIRVELKKDDGTPINPHFPTRDSVMIYLCDYIPKLKSRMAKTGGSEHSANSSLAGGGSGKKKGRSGRK